MGFKRLSAGGGRRRRQMQGGGEIGTMVIASTRRVIPPVAIVQNRCELAEEVGKEVGLDEVEFKRLWTGGER